MTSRGGARPAPTPPTHDETPADPEALKLATMYLASVTNDPSDRSTERARLAATSSDPGALASSDDSWTTYLGLGPILGVGPAAARVAETPPPLLPGVLPEVERADFDGYLARIEAPRVRFVAARDAAAARGGGGGGAIGERREDGDAGEIDRALRRVPSIYFREDFDLARHEHFDAACSPETSSSSLAATSMVAQERLSHHLDVVEVALVREIGRRSDAFFAASDEVRALSASGAYSLLHRSPRDRVGVVNAVTLPARASLCPPLASNPDTPTRRLSTPSDAFEPHPDVASSRGPSTLSGGRVGVDRSTPPRRAGVERRDARRLDAREAPTREARELD